LLKQRGQPLQGQPREPSCFHEQKHHLSEHQLGLHPEMGPGLVPDLGLDSQALGQGLELGPVLGLVWPPSAMGLGQ